MPVEQCSVSFNLRRGTLRGMHYQLEPRSEAKLVRCIQGVILDVIIDLRPTSPSYLRWQGFELTADNALAKSSFSSTEGAAGVRSCTEICSSTRPRASRFCISARTLGSMSASDCGTRS